MDKTLAEVLEGIEDFRQENSIEYKLIDILIIAILSTICGADTYKRMEMYARSKEEWLRSFLELSNGIPSAYTIRRVMMNINPKQFHKAFIEWVQIISEKISGVVAIDGKTARRTKGIKDGKKALHVVSAFALENKLVLGQIATEEKSNEITAIPELLKMLEIKGCIVTIDAMGTQKDIAKAIVEKEADYVLSLKENQKTLYEDIKLYTETELLTANKDELMKNNQYYCTKYNKHGRFEKREYYICSNILWLSQKDEWTKLTGFGVCVSTVKNDGTTKIHYNYAIYSVCDMTAKKFGEFKRGHWGIENSVHWILDLAFREDESRARSDYSAENLNIIRHLFLNLLKQEKTCKESIMSKRMLCSWENDYLIRVINSCLPPI